MLSDVGCRKADVYTLNQPYIVLLVFSPTTSTSHTAYILDSFYKHTKYIRKHKNFPPYMLLCFLSGSKLLLI